MNQRRKHRDQVVDTAHIVAKQMAEKLNGVYVFAQTGHVTTERAVETQTGFALGDDYEAVERVPFKAVIAGSEIVATAWDDEILRVDADIPDWGSTLRPAIKEALLQALNTLRAKRLARPI